MNLSTQEKLKEKINRLTQQLSTADKELSEYRSADKHWRLMQHVLDYSKDASFWIRSDGSFAFVNQTACESFGIKKDKLLQMSIQDFRKAYSKQDWNDFRRKVKENGNFRNEALYASDKGVVEQVEIVGNFIEFEGDEFCCVFVRNITDRKKTEETLKETVVKYSNIFEGASEGIIYADKKARVIEANSAITDLTGIKRDEIIGKSAFALVRELLSPKDIPRMLYTIAQNLIGIGTRYIELEFRGKILEISTRTRKDRFGIIAILRDVTEHRRFENQIRIQKELAIKLGETNSLKKALEFSLQAAIEISGLDSGGVYLVNETTGDLELHHHTGFSEDFVQSASRFSITSPHTKAVFKGESIHTGLTALGVKTKDKRRVEGLKAVSLVPLISEGVVIGCINVASHHQEVIAEYDRDALEAVCSQVGAAITRIRTSDALRKNEAMMKSIFVSTPIGVSLTIDRVLKEVNEKLCEMVGYTSEELLDKSVRMLYADQETYEGVNVKYALIKRFGIGNVESQWRRKDGKIIDVLLSAAPIARNDLSQGVISTCHDITDRKENERALRESEARYIDLYDNAPDMFISVDATTTCVIRCNQTFIQKTGFRKDEIIGRKVFTLYHTDCMSKAEEVFREFSKTGTVNDEELQICRKDGTVIDVSLSVSAVRNDEGKITASNSVLRDITDRKRLEEFNRIQKDLAIKLGQALRLDEALACCLKAAIESSGMDSGGVYILDEEAGVLKLSYVTGLGTEFIKSALSYSLDSPNVRLILKAKPVYTVYSELAVSKTDELKAEGLRGFAMIPVMFEGHVIGCMNLASHSRENISEHARIVLESIAGQVGSVIARMRAIEELRTSEEKYRIVVESSGLPIIYFDSAGVVRVINSVAAKGLGGKPDDFIGRSHTELFPVMAEPQKDKMAEVLETGVGFEIEELVDLPIGKRWVVHNAQPVKDIRGKTIGILDIAHDLTERKLAEEALRRSEERYRSLFEDDLTGDYISTPDGKIVTCNPAFVRIFGFDSLEETLSASMNSLYPEPGDRQTFLDDLTKAGKLEFYERKLLHKNGKTIHIIENSVGIFGEDGKLKLIRGYVIDNTERKKLEEQLQHAQRMEAIGRLAGGVAHDFNNLLTVITGNTDMALSALNPNDPLREDLVEVQTAADQAADLTQQLLAFSRKQTLQPKILVINHIIRNIDRMLRRLIGENIELTTILTKGVWKVSVDPGQIEQVIVNLAVNARDAMPSGGKLTIETQNVSISSEIDEQHSDMEPGNYVMLAISDTGSGIPDDIKCQIFDPFFTTKGQYEGTGLGLSTVYGIVKQSSGYIWVYSEQGKGTTFKIYLPRVVGEVEKIDLIELTTGMPKGNESILIVEDETGVRNFTRKVLEKLGYQVEVAVNGCEALLLCRKNRRPIDLLVTDVVMPRLGGLELAEEMRKIYKSMKVLYISGYTASAIFKHGILQDGNPYLQKPFLPQKLALKVREVLDDKS